MAAAAAPSVALTGVVLEPLSRDNYEDWSTLVKNYLAGQDLWDNIVEGDIITDNEQNQVWKLKNSRALHVIQLSCGNPSLAYVRHCKTAEEAWNILSVLFDGGRDLRSHIDDVEQGVHGSDDEMGLLHFAVATEQEEILNELLKTVDPSWLKLTDNQGNTLLALAAELTDNVNIAKIMVSTGGEDLLSDMNRKGEIPVLIASANGRKKLTRYLFSVTPVSVLVGDNYRYASLLFSRCISAEILDVAVALLQQHENALNLAIIDESNSGWSPIYALASIPSAFRSGILLGLIRKAFYEMLRVQTFISIEDERIEIRPSDGSQDTLIGRIFVPLQHFVQTSILLKLPGIKEIYAMKMNHYLVLEVLEYFCRRITNSSEAELRRWLAFDAMLQAADNGIIEFISSMMVANANLLRAIDKNRRGILAHAILNRQEKVFNLMLLIKDQKEISREDVLRNNILHLAADFGPFSRSTSGAKPSATIQLLRECLWFKEVKSIVPRTCSESKNELGFTPHELFTVNHERLVRDSQQWLKDTSTMSITVGTVIITLMFAAAITVPGGNDQDKGTPIFLGKKAFTLFTIFDIISLTASSSSVLTFIAILTSSYGEEDFIRSLPLKLLFGFLTLFISVTFMTYAFYATLLSSLEGYRWIITPAVAITGILISTVIPSMVRLCTQITGCIVRYHLLTTKKKKSWDS